MVWNQHSSVGLAQTIFYLPALIAAVALLISRCRQGPWIQWLVLCLFSLGECCLYLPWAHIDKFPSSIRWRYCRHQVRKQRTELRRLDDRGDYIPRSGSHSASDGTHPPYRPHVSGPQKNSQGSRVDSYLVIKPNSPETNLSDLQSLLIVVSRLLALSP
jgi:hypothetical protein